ncbi:MAG TPA: biotin transporter BioY [Candidatus Limnocylindrales bacterium]|nr:biotin transporter BioY [Candidatus Limnocylindrales bacterium]
MANSRAIGAAPVMRTLADAAFPAWDSTRAGPLLRAVLLVAGGALLTAVAAQLSFRMPWSAVPYTGQTGAVLLVGTVLGWRLGAASMLLYVLMGTAGAPVFAGGAHGTAQLLGVTGGYLAGFVLAAALVGTLAQRGWDRSAASAAALMAAGNLVIYAIGVPVLAVAAGMSLPDAAWSGAAVFLPWDAAKIALAAGLLPLAWRAVGGRRQQT